MPDEQVATYLNDHLAGSVAAIEILEYLERMHHGTTEEHFFTDIRDNVISDQAELEAMMARLGVGASATRKAGAWFASKLTEFKLGIDAAEGGPLRALEAMEILTMGIDGKRSLWRAMQESLDVLPELADVDFDRLIERAEEQRSRVEHARLGAAGQVFARLGEEG